MSKAGLLAIGLFWDVQTNRFLTDFKNKGAMGAGLLKLKESKRTADIILSFLDKMLKLEL